MARADEPGFGAPTGNTRAQRPLDPRVADPRLDPRTADPRRAAPDPRQDPRYTDPRLGDQRLGDQRQPDPRYYTPQQARTADPRDVDQRQPDPRQPLPRQTDPRMADPRPDPRPDPRLDPRAVPPTQARRPAIQPAADQSYVPQFNQYEPQRPAAPQQPVGRTVRQPALPHAADELPQRRPSNGARLDPSLFGPAAGTAAPLVAEPRTTSQRALPPVQQARAPYQAPQAAPAYGYDRNADAYEPPFETPQPRQAAAPAARGYEPQTAPMQPAGYPRTQSARPIAAAAAPAPTASPAWQDQHGHHGAHDDYDDHEGEEGFEEQEEEFEDDEPERPRSRRMLMVAGAIGLAVLIGGGVGLGYRMLGSAADGETPVVTADKAPVKKAAEKAAETGTKSVFKLGQDTASEPTKVAAAPERPLAAADAAGGPRVVATVTVKPGDTIEASSGVGIATSAEADVPGISLAPMAEDPPPQPAKIVKVKAKPAADAGEDIAAAADAVLSKPVKPKKPATVEPEETLLAAEPVSQPPKKLKVVAKVETKPAVLADDGESLAGPALTDGGEPAAPAAKVKPTKVASGGQGYVAQVRASKDRVEALGSFADLQQRFVDLLGSAQPDIQEADLGERGTWYRLRIGPPGSKKLAGDLCTQLKARGLKDCIVVAY